MPAQTQSSGKSIILFSDGTGNSSAKLFKTNVWRMYEAMDLGSGARQVAFYDNGVGTSSVRIFAMLGGIFGFGLKRNILRLYRFLCRNYQPGDRIYAFGFSRGAFTIRLLVGLIVEHGIVRYRSESELEVLSVDALRAFNSRNNPNIFAGLAELGRIVRSGWVYLKRGLLGQHVRNPLPPQSTDIEFVGVWDTVAAYGGPIAEVTRGIDDWIWPLTMTDYCLSTKVRRARHALALDDERDSFHPLLWDEVDWERKAREAHSDPTAQDEFRQRLRQVWFAGMHADVGGGYPDESLSFVSLLWMMQEASAAGLRLLEDHVSRIRNMANDFGPIHDSRSGLASYYRYQPRKIAAYLHPAASVDGKKLLRETLILRDPRIGEKKYRPQGLLLSCKLHESVVSRIASGTDDYAPITLPRLIELAPPPPPNRIVTRPINNPAAADALARMQSLRWGRAKRQERIWDGVSSRRYFYFLTVALSLTLLALPWWMHRVPPIPETTDARWVWGRITNIFEPAIPQLARPWYEALERAPVYFLLLLLALLIARGLGRSAGAKVHGSMRRLWDEVLGGTVPSGSRRSRLMRFRNSYGYQLGFQTLKWRILPNILGPALILLMAWALWVALTQFALLRQERGACSRSEQEPTLVEGTHSVSVEADLTCNRTGLKLAAGGVYRVRVQPQSGWKDGNIAVDPTGKSSADYPWYAGYPGALLRRVVSAKWMQLLYEVRPPLQKGRTDAFATIHIHPLSLKSVGNGTFEANMIAPAGGELFFFVNDASTFWNLGWFYCNNQGHAQVTISPVKLPGTGPVPRAAAASQDRPVMPLRRS